MALLLFGWRFICAPFIAIIAMPLLAGLLTMFIWRDTQRQMRNWKRGT